MPERFYSLLIYCGLIATFLGTTPVFAEDTDSTNLPALFQNLCIKYQQDYLKLRNAEYSDLCLEFDLDEKDSTNQIAYCTIAFIHDMLTSNSAINYTKGGILEVPYFWHWINPNPRHTIMYMPDSVRLNSASPPEEFSRYKTYADIDRVPSLFLSDLITDTPKYFHDDCGYFHTFGWCSEREMAYAALIRCLGYEGKIKQTGIHTWSEIATSFIKNDGSNSYLIAKVDNTFNTISWQTIDSTKIKGDWITDYGAGSQIKWYNKVAKTIDQQNKLKAIIPSRTVINRIDSLLSSFFGNRQN